MRRTVLIVLIGAITLPIMAFAQTTSSHGGSPSDVFASTEEGGGVCNGEHPVRRRAAALLPTSVGVDQPSHVLVSFTATTSTKEPSGPEMILWLRIAGDGWSESSPTSIQRQGRGHSIVAVTWTFDEIEAGDHTVAALTRVPGLTSDQDGTNLEACSLTVFVTPVA